MRIVALDHVSKRYRLSALGARSLREQLTRSVRRVVPGTRTADGPTDEILALQDVSLHVERGEIVGIIGPNGSGKSTILKLLARITYPTSGKISVLGSVASLIEVGAGFHPELTGRENIFLYGSIMGMRQADLRTKFDQIVDFAEVERFIDTPVKRYSSGMYVRLGFAVAVHVNPDVLLVDEVLAVGDAAFRSRCLQRIEELRRDGMSIVFVSHDMSVVERVCERAIFLSGGQIRAEGKVRQVVDEYYRSVVFQDAATAFGSTEQENTATGLSLGREAQVTRVRFLDSRRLETDTFATGDLITARIEYHARCILEDPVFELFFYGNDGHLYCHFTTELTGQPIGMIHGHGAVEMTCEELGLSPGTFMVGTSLTPSGALAADDRRAGRYRLNVLPGKRVRGLFYSPHHWRLLPAGPTPSESVPAAKRSLR